jgi:hypothetical protein
MAAEAIDSPSVESFVISAMRLAGVTVDDDPRACASACRDGAADRPRLNPRRWNGEK